MAVAKARLLPAVTRSALGVCLQKGSRGEEVLYTLTDGRQMRIAKDVASKISLLDIQATESFCICKRWNGRRRQPVLWDVWRTPAAERARAVEDMAETELESQLRQSITTVQKSSVLLVPKFEPDPQLAPDGPTSFAATSSAASDIPHGGNGLSSGHGSMPGSGSVTSAPQPSWAQVLQSQTQALTDVYAASIAYASEHHGNAVKPEDVRALMTTAFINLAQRGRYRVG